MKGLSYKAVNSILEIVVTRNDEVSLLEVQGVSDYEGRPTAITMGRQVGLVDVIAQEEGVPPLLRP